jgi:hypothetical protein
MTSRLDPPTFAKAVMLESADIPPHMTLAQWRLEKRAQARISRRRRRFIRVWRRARYA